MSGYHTLLKPIGTPCAWVESITEVVNHATGLDEKVSKVNSNVLDLRFGISKRSILPDGRPFDSQA